MDGLREAVIGWIGEFVPGYCGSHGEVPIWRAPLVGLADATSPRFEDIRRIGNPYQKLPSDYLEDAVTVISFFLPFSEEVSEDDAGGDAPTKGWAHAYNLTNAMAAELCEFIAGKVRALGYRAAVPTDAGVILDGTYSCWSQRHVARIAGLGSFGMNNMLNTESGCCGRFFSVITDVPCEHDGYFSGQRCLHKLNGGCGICMDVCPARALTAFSFERGDCEARCSSNVALVGEQVCGKCMNGMPCTFTDPSAERCGTLLSDGM